MYTRPDSEDQRIDRNLRAFGQRMRLPAEPSPAQRHAWRAHAPSTPLASFPQRLRRSLAVHRKGFWRFGTAAAAAVVLMVLVALPGRQQEVQAAMIFSSLRTSLWQGLRIDIERLEVEGIAIDGQLEVKFRQPISLAGFVEQADADDAKLLEDIDSVYADLKVVAGEVADEDVAGLDVWVRAGLTRETGWGFLKLTELPRQVVEEHPEAAIAVMMFRNGVLLNFDQFASQLFSGELSLDGDNVDVDLHLSAGDESERPSDASPPDSTVSVKLEKRIEVGGPAASEPSTVAVQVDGADSELNDVIQQLLSGAAGPEQLSQLARELEEGAGAVTVEARPDGLYILRASEFTTGDADADVLMRHARLEIGYRQGTGPEWLLVSNMGPRGGSVRVSFTNPTENRAVIERQRMIEQGVSVLDVGALMKMAEQMSQQSEPQ